MKHILLAALAAAAFAQPAKAQDDMAPEAARSLLTRQGASGEARMFWAKSGWTDDGPNKPVLAKLTRTEFARDCDMRLFFEDIDGHFAPYPSPMYVRWSRVRRITTHESYMQFHHELHGSDWGIVIPIESVPDFKRAAQALMEQCGGGNG